MVVSIRALEDVVDQDVLSLYKIVGVVEDIYKKAVAGTAPPRGKFVYLTGSQKKIDNYMYTQAGLLGTLLRIRPVKDSKVSWVYDILQASPGINIETTAMILMHKTFTVPMYGEVSAKTVTIHLQGYEVNKNNGAFKVRPRGKVDEIEKLLKKYNKFSRLMRANYKAPIIYMMRHNGISETVVDLSEKAADAILAEAGVVKLDW